MTTDEANPRFSLRYMLLWVAICAGAVACFSTSLTGGNGWLVGFSSVVYFGIGLILTAVLLFDPLRRINRVFRWPLFATTLGVCFTFSFLVWYVHSFIPIFLDRGIADPGKIAFKKLTLDSSGIVVIKYHVWDLPDCENTGYLIPWRDGGRSLSDDYLNSQPDRP